MPEGLPTRGEIEDFSEQLPDNFLECRASGHRKKLRIVRSVRFEGSSKYYDQAVYFCDNRCLTWVEIYDPDTGLPVHRSTQYDPAYLAKGVGRIAGVSRGIVRLELLKRAKERQE
jgi:hypothetical protein